MKLRSTLLILFCGLTISLIIGQETISSEYYEPERIDDPYMPPSKKSPSTSKAFGRSSDHFFCTQVNIDSTGANFLNDAANEPTIAINPLNPNEMVIAWRQFDNIESNFRQAGYGYTTDGGLTWTSATPIEPGVFRSDPVLRSDDEGRFYYNSLTLVDTVLVEIFTHTFISDEIGKWDEGTFAFGGDKQWMAIGKSRSGNPRIYLSWSINFTICDGSFTQSFNGGESYRDCVYAEFDTFLGTLHVGQENNLYAVGWHEDELYCRISDHRNTDRLWESSTLVDLGGTLATRDGPNPGGLLGQVDIGTDISSIDNQRYVYILSSVVPHTDEDPCDLMFARSTDGGLNFESPIRINSDEASTNYQWFGTMSVAPNGRIDVVWLDTRDEPGTLLSALYYSFSEDHGVTWSTDQKLTESFDPHVGWPNQNKMGDYFDMKSSDEGAHLAWCGTFNGEQDVYYAFIQPEGITTSVDEVTPLDNMLNLKILPNPSVSLPSIEISSTLSLDIQIQLLNIQGLVLSKGTLKNQGTQEVSLTNILNVPKPLTRGVYFLQFSAKNYGSIVKKIVIQ